jgi:predicted ribosome quality control (RQC) complex YloA/Tae2 family protein
MKLEGISLKEKRDYDSILFVKADTKRLKVIEYTNKKKVLLNKEREVRKVNAGGMAKKKYRRHYQHVKERTNTWFLENLEKLNDKKYDFLKLDIENEKNKQTILNFLKRRITNRKWFEKYRYEEFEKSLIIGGKDRKSNEELLKTRLSKEDIVFHTEMRGSPFFILKGNKDKFGIIQASLLTAFYSQDWKKNNRDVKVMYTEGKNIYKRKEMSTGTFGVRQDRSFIIVKKEELMDFKP